MAERADLTGGTVAQAANFRAGATRLAESPRTLQSYPGYFHDRSTKNSGVL